MTSTLQQLLLPRVNSAMQRGNGEMVKRAMQYLGLSKGASDTNAELAVRLVDYVEEGKLSEAQLERILREMHEYGSKYVYLLRGDPSRMRRIGPAQLARVVPTMDLARVAVVPAQPFCNYSFISDTAIRISFSERHSKASLERLPGGVFGVKEEEFTKVAVIHADLTSGLVTIMLDTPTPHNPHGDGALAYVEHYHDQARTLLNTDLVPLEWYDQIVALQKPEHAPVVVLGPMRVQDKQGLDFTMLPGKADLRDYDTFHSTAANVVLRKQAKTRWPRTPGTHAPDVLASGRVLLKEINAHIFASPATVRFGQHTLSHEMAYVLDYIRGAS